jgi:beta-fructofuranosidase
MPQRPQLHITAPKNWLNDPNGPVHHDGIYHLFFQYNPEGPVWGPPHWGHVRSTDLLRWERQPVALAPRPGEADADGCWSGCCRVVNGTPLIFYTAVTGNDDDSRVEAVCVAEGSPDLTNWTVWPEPLLEGAPPELGTGHHRDPYIIRDGDRWRMLLGSTTPGMQAGRAIHYGSDDLATWHFRGDYLLGATLTEAADIDTPRTLWECPQLLRSPEGDALIVSVQEPDRPGQPLRHVLAYLGEHQPDGFVAHRAVRLDHGDLFYAPAITSDHDGRILCWGWIQEPLSAEQRPLAPCVGALSLPRVITIEDGQLRVDPAPELRSLRHGPDLAGSPLRPGQARDVPATPFELIIEAPPQDTHLQLHSPDDEVLLTISMDEHGWQVLHPIQLPEPTTRASWKAGPTPLRILVDKGIVEVYATDGLAATTRIRSHQTTAYITIDGSNSQQPVSWQCYQLAIPPVERAGAPGDLTVG